MDVTTQQAANPSILLTPRELPEEIVNSVTHGIGLVLSMVGAVALVTEAYARGNGWHIFGCLVFVTTLVAVYATSTLSHAFQQPQLKRRFQILDQGCIYL